MPMKTALDSADEYVTAVESEVTDSLTQSLGRPPSQSEITQEAVVLGHSIGRPYGPEKSLVDSQPGLFGRSVMAVSDAAGSVLGPPLKFAGQALAERTESLRDEDSSMPTATVSFPGVGRARNALRAGQNAGLKVGQAMGVAGPFAQPLSTDRPPPTMTFGPEAAADAIEFGVPAVAEVGLALRKTANPTTFIIGTVLASMGAELGAEYLRHLNREVSGLPSNVKDIDTRSGMARHFAKVAVGGAILGTADIAFSSQQIRTQRLAYKKVLGLGSPESKENVERIRYLTGGKANLAEATTTGIRLIGHSLKVLPITSKMTLRRSRKIANQLGKRLGDSVSKIGDNLAAGLNFSAGVPSQAWQDSADLALQQSRKIGNAGYDSAKKASVAAELKYGRDAVHIPHHEIREDVDDFILGRTANLPLVGEGETRRVAKGAIEKDPNFQLLNDVLDLGDTAGIVEYMALRNELEAAAEAAGGVNTKIGSVYGLTAMKMRGAILKMNAPPDVKLAFETATQTWSDMLSFTQSSAWKHFRKADPKFGLPNKVGGKPSSTAEVTLQNAMNDKDLAPGIVETWWQAAKEGGSESQFKGAVETHLRLGFEQARSVSDKGPLAGIEVLDFKKFEKLLGADVPSSTKWAAHKKMMEKAGSDPDEMLKFVREAQKAFPEGIPNPSTTAARRVGLSGIKSAAKFASGVGLVGSVGGGPLTGIMSATGSFIALMGTGQLFMNPAVLRRMNRIMSGGMTEQGAWRTLWNTAKAMGKTRALQASLQEQGIDPLFTPSRAAQEDNINRLRARTTSQDIPGATGIFGKNPIMSIPEFPEDTPQLVPQR